MENTSGFAKASYFSCETVEDVNAFPKVCITAEVQIDKGEIQYVNTDLIKSAIAEVVKISVQYLPESRPIGAKKGGAK